MQGVRAYSSVDAVGSESGWHRRGRANGEGSTEAKKQPAVCVGCSSDTGRGEASGPRSIGALNGQLLRPLQDQHSTQLTLQHPRPAPKIRASSRYWPRAVGPLRRPSFSRLSCTGTDQQRPYIGAIGIFPELEAASLSPAKPVPSLFFLF